MKLYTIIVPIYKVEKYLERCVNSIINQTYKNLEIILVDDGSPDKCPKMCDDFGDKDSRIKVIHKKNGGLSDARNTGVKEACGDYILFVDSDDEISLTAVEELDNIVSTTSADIVCFNLREINVDTKQELKGKFYSFENSGDIINLTYSEAISDNIFRKHIRYEAVSRMYSASIAKKIEFPIGMYAEDFAVFYKFLKEANKIVHYEKQLYVYYKRSDSIMGAQSNKLFEDVFSNECNYYKEILNLKLSKNVEKKAKDNLFKTLIKCYSKLINSNNEMIIKSIELEISNIHFNDLFFIQKIIFILYKINKKIPVFFIKKLYHMN